MLLHLDHIRAVVVRFPIQAHETALNEKRGHASGDDEQLLQQQQGIAEFSNLIGQKVLNTFLRQHL